MVQVRNLLSFADLFNIQLPEAIKEINEKLQKELEADSEDNRRNTQSARKSSFLGVFSNTGPKKENALMKMFKKVGNKVVGYNILPETNITEADLIRCWSHFRDRFRSKNPDNLIRVLVSFFLMAIY